MYGECGVYKSANGWRGLVFGYGPTNLPDIEEGLRRLESILKKMESALSKRI